MISRKNNKLFYTNYIINDSKITLTHVTMLSLDSILISIVSESPLLEFLLFATIFFGTGLACREVRAPDCTQEVTRVSVHPHETRCELYHLCHLGHRLTFSCGLGRRFNEQLQACDQADNVQCDRCRDFVEFSCLETPTCTGFEWGKTKPYPPDCTKYIYCDVLGNSIIEDCTEGQHYSPELNICTDPAEANCQNCGEVTSSTVEVTEETTLTTLPECPPVPLCKNFEYKARLPYPPDCTKYIKCKILFEDEIWSCRAGKEFSVLTDKCEDPEIANCAKCYSSITTLEPITRTEPDFLRSVTYPILFNAAS